MITDREKIIAIVDNDTLWSSDAIILLGGDGVDRFRKAVCLYKEDFAPKIVVCDKITDYNYSCTPFSDMLPQMLEEGVPENDIIHEDKALSTCELAVEVVRMAIKNQWGKLILVASHDQQFRVYLAFLREVLNTRCGIALFNAPARNIDWFVDNGFGKRFNRLEGEIQMIEIDSEKGVLASAQEVIDYQIWKEKLYPASLETTNII